MVAGDGTEWRDKTVVTGAPEGHGNAVEDGDRRTVHVPGTAFEQDNARFQLQGFDCLKQLCNYFGFGELKGSNNIVFEKTVEGDTAVDDAGQRKYKQLLGRSQRLERPDIKKRSLPTRHSCRNWYQT